MLITTNLFGDCTSWRIVLLGTTLGGPVVLKDNSDLKKMNRIKNARG
jgi:hypothetical protein